VAPRAGLICPACGGGLRPWREVPGGEPSDHGRYELLRCASCGSAATTGPPPRADAYETGQYAPGEPRAAGTVGRLQRAATRQPVRFLRRAGLEPGARVLDVGAGRGRLVAELRGAGYDAHGIDPSRRSVELAAATGVAVERRDLFEHADSGLDAVVMSHVVEHLDDPALALAVVRGWLRPGGLLVIGVPNISSLQAGIGGDGWLHWDAPRHRVHFTADGLTRLLARSGFEPLRTYHWILDQNLHAMWMAMLTRVGMRPGYPFHFLKRNIEPSAKDLAITTLGIPLAPLAVALEAGASAARRGGTIAVVARAV
jgi:2-polyprenyl-3-methyl-5-hydroxy-6-metoxy-1,4-benzoquinol methylase